MGGVGTRYYSIVHIYIRVDDDDDDNNEQDMSSFSLFFSSHDRIRTKNDAHSKQTHTQSEKVINSSASLFLSLSPLFPMFCIYVQRKNIKEFV